jgi:hypothetical protein
MNVLLHICCGPCACYSVNDLREQGHTLTGFWFNPNIHPWTEYQKRIKAFRKYAAIVDLPIIERDQYPLEDWLKTAAENQNDRCRHCYRSRLRETAKRAHAEKMDAFTTTLLYSRYQKHEQIIEEGEAAAKEFAIPFLYRDLRVGWQKGIELSKQMELYRQQYCGCIYSEKERYVK